MQVWRCRVCRQLDAPRPSCWIDSCYGVRGVLFVLCVGACSTHRSPPCLKEICILFCGGRRVLYTPMFVTCSLFRAFILSILLHVLVHILLHFCMQSPIPAEARSYTSSA